VLLEALVRPRGIEQSIDHVLCKFACAVSPILILRTTAQGEIRKRLLLLNAVGEINVSPRLAAEAVGQQSKHRVASDTGVEETTGITLSY